MSIKKSEPSPESEDKKPKASAIKDIPQAPDGDENAGSGESGGDVAPAWGAGEAAEEVAVLHGLQADNAELKDQLLRAIAELENLRRRTEREKAETSKYAISTFARDVLVVGDNITRAISSVPEKEVARNAALKSLLEGVQMTERELVNTLERHGITKIDPKGKRFDPNRHQAMLEIKDKDVAEGTVVEVMQAGYVIEDRILRPAMVAIAKGGAEPPKPKTEPKTPKAANDDSPVDETGADAEPDVGAGQTKAPSGKNVSGKDGPKKADSAVYKPGAKIDKSA